MRRWAPIDIADALELLSPVFESEEVYRIFLLYDHLLLLKYLPIQARVNKEKRYL